MRFPFKSAFAAIVLLTLAAAAHAQFGAERASAVINLQSINGDPSDQSFTYSIDLTNNGTDSISTFWYAWVPPDGYYDLLPSPPTDESSPAGWSPAVLGFNDGFDNSSIQWTNLANPLGPGQTLTFGFTTTDSPDVLAGRDIYGFPIEDSYVYEGAAETDQGELFEVATGSTSVPEPVGVGLVLVGAGALVGRRRRA